MVRCTGLFSLLSAVPNFANSVIISPGTDRGELHKLTWHGSKRSVWNSERLLSVGSTVPK